MASSGAGTKGLIYLLALAACSSGERHTNDATRGVAGTPGLAGTLGSDSGGSVASAGRAGSGGVVTSGAAAGTSAGGATTGGAGALPTGGASAGGHGGSNPGASGGGAAPSAGTGTDASGGHGGSSAGAAGLGNPGDSGSEPLGTPTEQALPDLDAVRQEHSVVALDGKVYVIGGYVNNTVTASVLAYDPATMKYTSAADFPGPLNHGNAGAVNGKIYVAGCYVNGGMSTATTENYAYDPAADKWTAAAPLPAGTERGAACVAVDGNSMYVIGGAHDGMSVDDVARYDATTDTWAVLAKLPERREHCAAGVIGGIIYVGGGRKDGITGVEPKTWAYDPAEDAWSEKAPIDPARGGLAGAVLRGRLIVFGGEGNMNAASGVFPDIDAYDPVADTWTKIGEMQTPRHGYGAAVVGDRVYLLGGATKQGGGADKKSSVFYLE